MGFYIRKAFSFGPLRLNLSRSGLGASFGVKGARIGVGPRGSYIHMGRGGVYYRQSLVPHSHSPAHNAPSAPDVPNGSAFEEITSAAANSIADSSAEQLLQELNRVKRRVDLFPSVMIAGLVLATTLIVRVVSLGMDLWLSVFGVAAIAFVIVAARHYDVTNGTALLTYSLDATAEEQFSRVRTALQKFASCNGIWYVDASAAESDWKRNAGANSLLRRSDACVSVGRPPKVVSNIETPVLKMGRKALYFFPDRLLLYDSGGVGAVSYGDLNARAGQTRFIENGSVPRDAVQVGTTWLYVAKSGGPDRRFNNNRQLPVMSYGELVLTSHGGIRESFQCSVPSVAMEVAALITEYGSFVSSSSLAGIAVSFGAVGKSRSRLVGATLWGSVALMAIMTLLAFRSLPSFYDLQQREQAQAAELKESQKEQAEIARRHFAEVLGQRLLSKHLTVEIKSSSSQLSLRFIDEGPQAARRDGVDPFNSQLFLERVMQPSTENDLCALGFLTLVTSRKALPVTESRLSCGHPH